MLKSRQNDFNEERLLLTQTQYEDERQRNQEMQSRLNEARKEIIELECLLKDMKKKDNEDSFVSSELQNSQIKAKDEMIADLKGKLIRAQSKIEEETKRFEISLKQAQAKIDALG